MRQSIQSRLYGVIFQAVKEAALGAQFECDITACYAPEVNQAGQMTGLQHSWLVTVSTPNPLLGMGDQKRPDIAASIPIGGVVPPDEIFVRVAQNLWKKVSTAKDEVLTKPAALGMDLTRVGK